MKATPWHECPVDAFTQRVLTLNQKAPSSSKRLWLTDIACSRRYAGLYVLYRRNFITGPRPRTPVVSHGMFYARQKQEKPVYNSKTSLSSGWLSSVLCAFGIMVFTRSLTNDCILYLMHMHLINDAVYQKGSMCLINNMRLIARCA